ncbi:MAG TPA: hypothetical protein VFZ65_16000 [Planctomycetota bacterium]|nr:hypothetical protein [Planctomycetota bacterium]
MFATHDWNGVNVNEQDTWADVKTPGDGRTYSVGSTIASPPGTNSSFSTLMPSYPPGAAFNNATKQVAIIQIAEPGQPAGIRGQAYFHGMGSNLGGYVGASTFARAISVWPAPTLAQTRIAICGSTRDPSLPLSPTPFNNSGNIGLGGVWARHRVHRGLRRIPLSAVVLPLLRRRPECEDEITDVSIRVELDAMGQPKEYVTYCGATRNGNPAIAPPSTMLPGVPAVGPFVAPPAYGNDMYAGGDSDNGAYTQWDGIVGRVSFPNAMGNPELDFHSIVGGAGDDALLGIAQKSLGEFVVVGTTQFGTVAGGLAFPLTAPDTFANGTVQFSLLTSWSFGVALRFTAPTPANPLANLQLDESRLIGTDTSHTIARDVLWQDGPGLDWIYGRLHGLRPARPGTGLCWAVGRFLQRGRKRLLAGDSVPQRWLVGRPVRECSRWREHGQWRHGCGRMERVP